MEIKCKFGNQLVGWKQKKDSLLFFFMTLCKDTKRDCCGDILISSVLFEMSVDIDMNTLSWQV